MREPSTGVITVVSPRPLRRVPRDFAEYLVPLTVTRYLKAGSTSLIPGLFQALPGGRSEAPRGDVVMETRSQAGE